jgi:hypothetical protein
MLVIAGLQTISHREFVDIFMISSSNGSLLIAIKQKANLRYHTDAMLLFYIP